MRLAPNLITMRVACVCVAPHPTSRPHFASRLRTVFLRRVGSPIEQKITRHAIGFAETKYWRRFAGASRLQNKCSQRRTHLPRTAIAVTSHCLAWRAAQKACKPKKNKKYGARALRARAKIRNVRSKHAWASFIFRPVLRPKSCRWSWLRDESVQST